MTSPGDLIEGFHRFREQHFTDDDALYRQLVQEGQTPKILVVACCDSRVDPALVLDCAPGDLFVIRNVANLVPPEESRGSGRHGTSAALEYGVSTLGVEHIIVLGHAHCGGIRALMSGQRTGETDSFINSWMRLAEDARAGAESEMAGATLEERERAIEQRAILGSLDNLRTFAWIRERIEQGTLTLHGWYFDMEHGQLLGYDAAKGRFELL
ncbi:carbonic anhydrase [Ferrigenium kumadai]|uniref:Carbonic anhydrase n=1 Tax=Ferrigenium kumadai TaxID=1682490 RepID=A0AAN1SXG1_9PROT|nr:carbonic anhydrase [Ferrigenium kumadai]BBI98341.1 carbonic anhydrase [Ferrigenium kumadai]